MVEKHDSSSSLSYGAQSDTSSNLSSSKKRTIEEFSLMKEIGQGAFGTVYLALDKMTDKQVAIKSVS